MLTPPPLVDIRSIAAINPQVYIHLVAPLSGGPALPESTLLDYLCVLPYGADSMGLIACLLQAGQHSPRVEKAAAAVAADLAQHVDMSDTAAWQRRATLCARGLEWMATRIVAERMAPAEPAGAAPREHDELVGHLRDVIMSPASWTALSETASYLLLAEFLTAARLPGSVPIENVSYAVATLKHRYTPTAQLDARFQSMMQQGVIGLGADIKRAREICAKSPVRGVYDVLALTDTQCSVLRVVLLSIALRRVLPGLSISVGPCNLLRAIRRLQRPAAQGETEVDALVLLSGSEMVYVCRSGASCMQVTLAATLSEFSSIRALHASAVRQ